MAGRSLRNWLRKQISKWPLLFYRCGLGDLIARRVLVLSVRGRETGKVRKMPLWYVKPDDDDKEVVFCLSRRGPSSQWLRNLRANPVASLEIGREVRRVRGQVMVEAELSDGLFQRFQSKYGRLGRLLLRRELVILVCFSRADTKD